MLAGYHDWQWIIARTTLHLIYQGATADKHCPPCTVMSIDAEQTMKVALQKQGPAWPTGKAKSQTMSSYKVPKIPAPRTPTIQSVVNMPLRATSSHSAEGVVATSLDYCREEDEEDMSFHQFHHHQVQQSSTHKEMATLLCQVACLSLIKNNPIYPVW